MREGVHGQVVLGAAIVETGRGQIAGDQAIADEEDNAEGLLNHPGVEKQEAGGDEDQD